MGYRLHVSRNHNFGYSYIWPPKATQVGSNVVGALHPKRTVMQVADTEEVKQAAEEAKLVAEEMKQAARVVRAAKIAKERAAAAVQAAKVKEEAVAVSSPATFTQPPASPDVISRRRSKSLPVAPTHGASPSMSAEAAEQVDDGEYGREGRFAGMKETWYQERGARCTVLAQAKQEWELRNHATTTADDIGRLAVATVSSKQTVTKDAGSMANAEYTIHAQRHKRSLMSKELVRAKKEWEQREHSTVADDIGHIAAQTMASKHKQDAKDADHMAEAEFITYMQMHKRSLMSQELAKAKNDYQNRDHRTVALDVGRLGLQLETAKYHASHKDADHMADREYMAYVQLHKRDLMSLELIHAKKAYGQRDLVTVTDDIGLLGNQPEFAKYRAGFKDSDHMAGSEFISYMSKHERELLSNSLTQSGDEWKLRQRNGQLYRPPSLSTSSLKPLFSLESRVGDAERSKKEALKSRDALSTEGTSAKEAWLKRRLKLRVRLCFIASVHKHAQSFDHYFPLLACCVF